MRSLSAYNLKDARYVLQSSECSSVKSVHRGSLSNSRPYNIIVQYKCALENNEYGRRHSLDIGGRLIHVSCILVVISATKTSVD